MSSEEYPSGAGNLPGGSSRQRRRGSLPTDDNGSSGGGAPIGAHSFQQQSPPAEDASGLNVTERPKLPDSKVLGLRMSQQHYETANTMVDVLATKFRLDKRQIGELIVQYLVTNRFGLYEYVSHEVGPAIDLDFFTRNDQ